MVVVSPSDMDMAPHEGGWARVEGTLDTSSSSTGARLLLLSPFGPQGDSVRLCQQSVNSRLLTWTGHLFKDNHKWTYYLYPPP